MSTALFYKSFLDVVKELREMCAPRSGRAITLCKVERLLRPLSSHARVESKSKVVTFGVNYDGVFTRESLSFMRRFAKLKYQATHGCCNYLER